MINTDEKERKMMLPQGFKDVCYALKMVDRTLSQKQWSWKDLQIIKTNLTLKWKSTLK